MAITTPDNWKGRQGFKTDYEKEADELVDKFLEYAYVWEEGYIYTAKDDLYWNATKCAIICLEEKIKIIDKLGKLITEDGEYNFISLLTIKHEQQIEYLKGKL